MSRPSRMPVAWVPFVAALATLGVNACFNFDGAYKAYCADTGSCDAGGPGSDGGGASNDGGTDGGGGQDGGVAACLPFGSPCTAFGQCCDPSDAGAAMGCSRLGYCQPRPRECQEDAYKCGKDSECCSGHCVGGTCTKCADSNTGASCGQADDCCFFFSSACNASNVCVAASVSNADGYHCTSADFCNGGYCQTSDAGPPPDGICTTPSILGCRALGQTVGIGQSCCPGTAASAGTCCLPNDSYCYYDTSCCSGSCKGGRCVPAGTGGGVGDRCLSSNECTGQLLCDPVSRTCTGRWCMGPSLPHPGCCSFSSDIGACQFPDGGSCLLPNASCSTGSQCCSGTCLAGGTCDSIIFF